MLYTKSAELFHLITGSLYPLTTFTYFPHSHTPAPTTTNLFCFYIIQFKLHLLRISSNAWTEEFNFINRIA